MLVFDIADNFFQNILECYKAHHFAIFIDDKREMRFAVQEGFKLFGEGGGQWDKPRIKCNGIEIDFCCIAACGI